jgi:NAD(P)H-dependent flavin oxidoreductase YrpB (nitropropane dioxygenase family)
MSADRVDNPLCRLLGIGYPILQAGMYQVAWGPLAAAVSNAGGLGVIGPAFMPSSRLRREIRIAKAETDRPFGVDILFAKVPAGGATITRSWQGREAEIKPYPHQLKEVGGPASQPDASMAT